MSLKPRLKASVGRSRNWRRFGMGDRVIRVGEGEDAGFACHYLTVAEAEVLQMELAAAIALAKRQAAERERNETREEVR